MLRETTLNTKRLELGNCVGARKRKLSELYHVAATVAATVTTSFPPLQPSQPSPYGLTPISESEFQSENDITQGKQFNVATLRRLPGGESNFTQSLSTDKRLDLRTARDGNTVEARSTLQKSGLDAQGLVIGELAEPRDEKRAVQDIKRSASPADTLLRDATAGTQGRVDALRWDQQSTNGPSQDQADQDAKALKSQDGIKTQARDGDPEALQSSDQTNVTRPGPDGTIPTTGDAAAASGSVQDANGASGSAGDGPSTSEGTNASIDNTIASRRRLENAKETPLNQRPAMRIDTGVGRTHPVTESSTPSSSFTPLRSAQAAMQSSPPERMTTRVSSGALRHKSVSEILGETPKLSPSQGERAAIQDLTRDENALASRRSSFVASPESMTFKSRPLEPKDREKDRSKLSTVVFARHQVADGSRPGDAISGHASRKDKSDENKDYLVPLFAAQAAAQNPSLNHLISSAHKTLSTANHYIDYHESQDCRILKRIYHLQNSNRWSLRQLERSAEPLRPTTHWDNLLSEVKWMRTDFREERKWKLTAARNLAKGCAEWVAADKEVRKTLQVKVRAPTHIPATAETQTTPSSVQAAPEKMDIDSTPELVHSVDDDTSDAGEEDVRHPELVSAPAPATLFSLAPDDVLFSLDKTPISEKLLAELPLYQPFQNRRGSDRPWSQILDAAWQKPIVPVSKHAVGKIVVRDDGPKRKRSRYEYVPEDEEELATLAPEPKKGHLPAEQNDVALFDPKNKHIVDRLHAGHAFRPPSQHPMPSQAFFECRYPSQWTTAEDDELRKLVRDYEYNWNAISDFLTSQSLFSSGAERRTPWECFERWESFEGLPGEMDKHTYFRAWRSRKLNAKARLEENYQRQQQNPANAQIMRRRTAEPTHVERRKSDKHYALIGAIAKVAKKRENHLQKQQHAAQIAAIRKQPETAQPRLRMQTPQEFSAHKHKQEMEFKEKQMLYRQQMETARRNAMQQQKVQNAQNAQQQQQQAAGLGVPPQARMGVPGPVNGTSSRPGSNGQSTPQVANRPVSSSQGMLNGMVPNGAQVPMNRQAAMMAAGGMGVPQAQMQGFMQGQHPGMAAQNGNEASRVMSEAMRLQEQQRLMQRQRAQPNGQNPMASLPNGNGMSHQQMRQNATLLGNFQHNPQLHAMNGMTPGQQRSSASMMSSAAQAQQLSSGMVPLLNQISNNLRAQHPTATTDQIKQMATMNLNQHLRKQNAQAASVNGASVNGGHGQMAGYPTPQSMNFNAAGMSPQMYAQFLRSHQASQQSRHSAGPSTGAPSSGGSNEAGPGNTSRPGSRGTPGSQSRGPSAAPKAASSSPHPPQAQIAGSSS